MSPIENMLYSLSTAIFSRISQPQIAEQLTVADSEEWKNVLQEIIIRLIVSMHRRVNGLLQSRGEHIDS